MNRILLAIGLISLFACQSNQKPEEEYPDIASVFAAYNEDYLKLFPFNATMQGDNRYNDLFPNELTAEFKEQIKTFYSNYLQKLAEYDVTKLNEEDQMSYRTMQWQCEIELEKLEFPVELLPVDQFWSTHLAIGQLGSGSSFQPFNDTKDYENWLKRLEGFLAWSDTAMANMKKGIEAGIVLPKSLTKKVIPQFTDFAKMPVEENLFFSPVKAFPDGISPEDRDRLKLEYSAMVATRIVPTYSKFVDFLKNEYMDAGRETSGIGETPLGAAYYANRIKHYTTTDMTADEIFNLGESEVARISSEMEKVMEQVGFEGDLKDFFDYVRNKKELMPFSDPQQVIDNFNDIHEDMKPYLEKLFGLKPKTPFVVKRTEAFREASASAEYNPGSLDGTRPGVFYVPIPSVEEYNVYGDESLFLHEAIPGHHYQISLQQENTDLPDFRKSLWYSAYGEGWALYTETLGSELGLFKDPYQYFGMLSAEMHRAIRLVVDAGLHSKGWTREQAIQYSLDHEAESEASIISEVERYMAGPGQALSYKVGQLKIRELRGRAEKAMGNDFDVREFHTKVLESGCIPLKLLEDKIDKWIADSK